MYRVTESFVPTGDLEGTAARVALSRSEPFSEKKALLLTELTVQ
jgi:hypothetical protein